MSEEAAKTQSLAINERLPFAAKYHEEDGKSVCTVEQGDLEAFINYHNAIKSAFKFAKIALVVVTVSAVYLGYLTLNSIPEVRYIIPQEVSNN